MLSGREHGAVDDEPLLEDDGDNEGAFDAEELRRLTDDGDELRPVGARRWRGNEG